MKMILYFIILILVYSCNQYQNQNERERQYDQADSFLNEYVDIIRHPISLHEIIDSSEWSQIEFESVNFNFDTIDQGSIVSTSFKFNNSGNKSLYILDTKVSCGCTITDYQRGGIMPGESGKIDVFFDSTGKSGFQEKTILVVSNSNPNEVSLKITGFVNKEI